MAVEATTHGGVCLSERREKGLAKAGNARVRRGVIQLAWRFLMFQKDSALTRWYRTRTEGPSGAQDDDDRGAGAQTVDRAVALGHDRRSAGRRRAAAGRMSNTLKNEKGQTGFGA